MAPQKSANPKDLLYGGILSSAEALSIGMPFEVWKTHMGSYRNQGTIEAFRTIYRTGGPTAFWKGWQPKFVESFLKGAILLFSKEAIINALKSVGTNEVAAGLIGGFGGGVAQVVVLGPCTYLITSSVTHTGPQPFSIMGHMTKTYNAAGIGGFYKGGVALMLRQGSNWASRQGITDFVRVSIKRTHGGNQKEAKLSILEETAAGIIGGTLSAWNQPFEVMRIEAQAAAARGEPPKNIVQTYNTIVKDHGFGGLFRGIVPRAGLCVAQTLFMITLPYVMQRVWEK